MASAGQAQAHSSQPTHFSRPSGCRFSWWRPWKRGWVARLTSGYSSVSSLRNIVANVTPKPATGAKSSERKLAFFCSSATGGLLIGQFWLASRARRRLNILRDRLAQMLAGQRGDRVAARERVYLLRALDRDGGGGTLAVPDPGDGKGNDGDHADHDDRRRPGVLTEEGQLRAADEGHRDDPEQGHRDEELPAEPHELVVTHPREGSTEPDEEEHDEPQLDDEPEQSPPTLVEHPVVDRGDARRRLPATQEHRGRQRGHGEHVDVLTEEEHREPHRAVFRVETTGQLALAFSKVEGQPVGLAEHGHDIDQEREERREDEPQVLLRGDDL